MIQHPSFRVEPWALHETALSMDVLAQTESLFALSNGHIGLRGNLDEGEPHGLPGSYLNGFFELRPLPSAESQFGAPESSQTLIDVTNAINADKDAAAKIMNEELKRETGKSLKPEVLENAMKRVEFTWDPIPSSLRESAEDLHAVGFLRQTPNITGIYQLDPLNQVLEGKHLPSVKLEE